MKKLICYALSLSLIFIQIPQALAKRSPQVVPVSPNLEATVYSYHKSRHFVAVEIGFTNNTKHYIRFTPNEIYLNDKTKYSVAPMPNEKLEGLAKNRTSISWIPLVLSMGLGIAAAIANFYDDDLARDLSIAALAMGGVYLISAVLEQQMERKQLIPFRNNNLRSVTQIPPGMTVGGFLYFPYVKSPVSLTLVSKGVSQPYQKQVVSLKKVKKSKKTKMKGAGLQNSLTGSEYMMF